jgi:hypothetical protein
LPYLLLTFQLYRLPTLNIIERFWKVLRRRATHNRHFKGPADSKRSLRANLCYFQTVRGRIRSPVAGYYSSTANQKASETDQTAKSQPCLTPTS